MVVVETRTAAMIPTHNRVELPVDEPFILLVNVCVLSGMTETHSFARRSGSCDY